jgi:hypothetical protein
MGAVVGLDPTSGPLPTKEATIRPRPPSLDGAVIGLVANGLGQSEPFLRALYGQLSDVASVAGAVPVLKGSVSVPPDPGDWDRLTSEATVAITGFGG